MTIPNARNCVNVVSEKFYRVVFWNALRKMRVTRVWHSTVMPPLSIRPIEDSVSVTPAHLFAQNRLKVRKKERKPKYILIVFMTLLYSVNLML